MSSATRKPIHLIHGHDLLWRWSQDKMTTALVIHSKSMRHSALRWSLIYPKNSHSLILKIRTECPQNIAINQISLEYNGQVQQVELADEAPKDTYFLQFWGTTTFGTMRSKMAQYCIQNNENLSKTFIIFSTTELTTCIWLTRKKNGRMNVISDPPALRTILVALDTMNECLCHKVIRRHGGISRVNKIP